MFKYVVNKDLNIDSNGVNIMNGECVVEAISLANDALKTLNDTTLTFDINIFETLGLRNLSGLVGEYFSRCVMKVSNGKLYNNLHQDGYPDLVLIDTEEKKRYFDSIHITVNGKKNPLSKELFSPYKYGGIEIKATCGSTPPASKCPKPMIGEQRIEKINSFDWKAHHRSTNNLLAILWDFINNVPTIVAAFYQSGLTPDDWGNIVQPRTDGGRTTSVSIMKSSGVKKMCQNWVAVIDEETYIKKLADRKWIGHRIK